MAPGGGLVALKSDEGGMARRNFISFSPFVCPTVKSKPMNRLLFGDNLGWLRDARIFPDANVNSAP
jgi:hypothetical protein